jgi:hypothetical protein
MKNLYLISILYLIPVLTRGQDVTFDLVSKSQISVRNNNNFSTRVLVYDKDRLVHDRILQPTESNIFSYQYSKSEVDKITYKAVYDDKALEVDINRIEAIKNARDRRRADEGMWMALGAFIDQTFFNGTFSTLFEIGSYGNMLFNGATEEEWAEALIDSGVGFGIDEYFDKDYQKGLAAGAFELAKSMRPREYKDLQDWLVYFMKKRESKYVRVGKVTDSAKLPKKKALKYPYFSISGAYPINQEYAEDAYEENADLLSVKGEKFKEEYPFNVRLEYKFKSTIGIFAEYSKSNIFKNPDLPNFQYLKPNNAFRFTTYSLGISPSYSFLEFGLGATYMQQENFLIESSTNQLQSINETNKWGGFIEPRINIRIGNPVTIFGSWKLTVFGDKEIEKTLLKMYNYNIGIGINFRKRVLDFSN